MKTTTWAALGSLFINVMLGLVIAAVFSAAPSAQAAEPAHVHCAGQAKHAKQAPTQTAPAPTRRAYLVEVRMGWGPAG
jgi:hypothetical protein